MKYCQIKRLSSTKFKRITGVKRRTYQLMVRQIKGKKAEHKKPGRPPELIIEDQVLVALQYWREYRTYASYRVRFWRRRINSLSSGSQN